jgi:hypothetical protein
MKDNKTIKEEIEILILEGRILLGHEVGDRWGKDFKVQLEKMKGYKNFLKQHRTLQQSYQKWYTTALPIVKQLVPERYADFISYYKVEKREEINLASYNISDYVSGIHFVDSYTKQDLFDPFDRFYINFLNQIGILSSCIPRLDSILTNIEGVLQGELFESELESAKDLLSKNHIRASGALAGVTLETHLSKVCKAHSIILKKANPTISDYNEELKNKGIVDIPAWRLIQRLGDIRNLAVHSKEREPTKDEIGDLIRGCEKLIAELS